MPTLILMAAIHINEENFNSRQRYMNQKNFAMFYLEIRLLQFINLQPTSLWLLRNHHFLNQYNIII